MLEFDEFPESVIFAFSSNLISSNLIFVISKYASFLGKLC
jgi:hypothetical protein